MLSESNKQNLNSSKTVNAKIIASNDTSCSSQENSSKSPSVPVPIVKNIVNSS